MIIKIQKDKRQKINMIYIGLNKYNLHIKTHKYNFSIIYNFFINNYIYIDHKSYDIILKYKNNYNYSYEFNSDLYMTIKLYICNNFEFLERTCKPMKILKHYFIYNNICFIYNYLLHYIKYYFTIVKLKKYYYNWNIIKNIHKIKNINCMRIYQSYKYII